MGSPLDWGEGSREEGGKGSHYCIPLLCCYCKLKVACSTPQLSLGREGLQGRWGILSLLLQQTSRGVTV